MSQLLVDDIVNKDDSGSPEFSKGVRVTGITTSTSFSGPLTGDVTGAVTGNVTGNVTVNVNSSSSSGISTVGILTAYDSITVKVGSGSTELTTAIKTNTTNIATKASTGKAIAMAMVFG